MKTNVAYNSGCERVVRTWIRGTVCSSKVRSYLYIAHQRIVDLVK
jgi:hypothetical protein